MKWLNVMVPLPMQVPGPTAALKLAGSQGPCIRTTNGLVVATKTMAPTNGVRAIASLPQSVRVVMCVCLLEAIEAGGVYSAFSLPARKNCIAGSRAIAVLAFSSRFANESRQSHSFRNEFHLN